MRVEVKLLGAHTGGKLKCHPAACRLFLILSGLLGSAKVKKHLSCAGSKLAVPAEIKLFTESSGLKLLH